MLNRMEAIGNMGSDAEVRSLTSGEKVANFSLGVTEKWTKKDGEKHERTEWIRCVAFGNVVDVIEKYTKKGSKIYVAGKWQTRSWEDRDGNKKHTTECVLTKFDGKLILLDSRNQSNDERGTRQDYQKPQEPDNFDDTSIPF